MDNQLGNKVAKGVVWQTIGRYSALVVQFIVTMILSRLIDPKEFGVIGILTVFISLSSVFFDAGLAQSLIQKGNPNQKDYSSVFYFNIIVSTGLYLILFFFLPYIGIYYHNDDLSKYGRLLFLVIPISSVCIVQDVILTINLRFKYLSIIQITSAFLSGIVGVILAYTGYGIYALVFHSISLNLSKALLLAFFTKWHPTLEFSWGSLKLLLPFGISLLITNLVKTLFNNIYTLIIGRAYTSKDVAYYNQAQRLEELSGYTLLSILISVTYPVFVKIRDNIAELRSAYKRLLTMSCILMVPVFCILFLGSSEVIEIVFSSAWLPAAPLLKILCIYGMALPLHLINENILKVFGEGKKILFVEIIRRVCIILALIPTIQISVEAMLIGQVAAMIPVIYISMSVSGKFINYSFFQQMKDVLPFYLVGLVCCLLTYFFVRLFTLNCFLSLLLKAAVFSTCFLLVIKLFKLYDFSLLLQLINKKN